MKPLPRFVFFITMIPAVIILFLFQSVTSFVAVVEAGRLEFKRAEFTSVDSSYKYTTLFAQDNVLSWNNQWSMICYDDMIITQKAQLAAAVCASMGLASPNANIQGVAVTDSFSSMFSGVYCTEVAPFSNQTDLNGCKAQYLGASCDTHQFAQIRCGYPTLSVPASRGVFVGAAAPSGGQYLFIRQLSGNYQLQFRRIFEPTWYNIDLSVATINSSFATATAVCYWLGYNIPSESATTSNYWNYVLKARNPFLVGFDFGMKDLSCGTSSSTSSSSSSLLTKSSISSCNFDTPPEPYYVDPSLAAAAAVVCGTSQNYALGGVPMASGGVAAAAAYSSAYTYHMTLAASTYSYYKFVTVLVPSVSSSTGQVTSYTKYSVCSSIDQPTMNKLCEWLGFGNTAVGIRYSVSRTSNSPPLLYATLTCPSTATEIGNCTRDGSGSDVCLSNKDLSLACSVPATPTPAPGTPGSSASSTQDGSGGPSNVGGIVAPIVVFFVAIVAVRAYLNFRRRQTAAAASFSNPYLNEVVAPSSSPNSRADTTRPSSTSNSAEMSWKPPYAVETGAFTTTGAPYQPFSSSSNTGVFVANSLASPSSTSSAPAGMITMDNVGQFPPPPPPPPPPGDSYCGIPGFYYLPQQ